MLGPNATDAQKAKLESDVDTFMAPLLKEKDVTDAKEYLCQRSRIRSDGCAYPHR